MSKKCYAFRRIEFETLSAMYAGSGESDPVQDMPIQTDPNGLPAIKATSIAGVLRHLYSGDAEDLFGSSSANGRGSRIFVENAIVCDENNQPVEGLRIKLSDYLERIKRQVQRDHCKLDHRGVAENAAKFDRTVLIAGIRFITEFSVIADSVADAKRDADAIADIWNSSRFRLGGGTRNGFGRIRIRKITGREYDLNCVNDRQAFLNRSASLAELTDDPEIQLAIPKNIANGKMISIKMTPENFWLVASGYGEDDVDITPKSEQKIVWNDAGQPGFVDFPLLPATSVKGALAHRVAFHYNKIKGHFADKLDDFDDFAKKENPAVKMLFGSAKNDSASEPGSIGRVIISDIYCESAATKIFNHVKIDRFTGGAFDGALFSEKVFRGGDLTLEIYMDPVEDKDVMKAFDLALADICNGMLPLGGGTMRGYGAMKATEKTEC